MLESEVTHGEFTAHGPIPPDSELENALTMVGVVSRVRLLVDCYEAGRSAAAPAVRRFISQEANPVVLATMASILGRHGSSAVDSEALLDLLRHQDERVVANALEALFLLQTSIPADELRRLSRSSNDRVRRNALGFQRRQTEDRKFKVISELARSEDRSRRECAARLLRIVPDCHQVLEILVEMLAREDDPDVLSQIRLALAGHASTSVTPQVLNTLRRLKSSSSGSTANLIQGLIDQVSSQLVQ